MKLKAARTDFSFGRIRNRFKSVVDSFHRNEDGAAPAFAEPAMDEVAPVPVRTGLYLKARTKDELDYSADEKELIDDSDRFRQALYAEAE